MRDKVRENWRKLLNEELDNFYAHSLADIIKSKCKVKLSL
jgi:hypothetical protein